MDISKKAASYKINSKQVDGMSVMDVSEAAKEAVNYVRAGDGPVFLECLTYRFRAHSMFDAELYREKTEVSEWKKRDPLTLFQNILEEMKLWEKVDVKEMEDEIATILEKAIEFAENGTLEPISDLEKFVYSEEVTHG